MAASYFSQAFLLPPRSQFSILASSSPLQRHHFCPSPETHHHWLLLTLPPTRCLGPNKSSLPDAQRASSGALSENECTQTDSKNAALDVGRGSKLIAFYSDHHIASLPDELKSRMEKYQATRLLLEGDTALQSLLDTRPSPLAAFEELCLVHEEWYVRKVLTGDLSEKEQRNLGLKWSPELVKWSFATIGGTVAAVHTVMLGLRRAAGNISSCTQHAFLGHGEGFCVFNDVAVAASVALQMYPEYCKPERPVLVIDLDVHQGNGTSKFFEGDNRIVTFSMHGGSNYSWNTKMHSSYNLNLLDTTGDEYYIAVLSNCLKQLFNAHSPSLVFFQAGVDALSEDMIGRPSMTRQGLLHRNNMVYTACLTRKLPLVITVGGGHSTTSEATNEAQADVYRSAALRFGGSSAFLSSKQD